MVAVLKGRRPWLGKAAGAGLGVVTGGPVGLVVGAVAGHLVDRVSARAGAPDVVFREDHIDGLFRLAGHLAKADGPVKPAEIEEARNIMDKLRLTPARRKQVIQYFTVGKTPVYRPDRDLYLLNASLSSSDKEVMLSLLMKLAYADKGLQSAEVRVLERVCDVFNIGSLRYLWVKYRVTTGYDWLRESQVSPERRFRKRLPKRMPAAVQNAYAILGLETDVSDADLKITYRRRMSEFHPDKLHSSGASVTEIEFAKEKAQAIQKAYYTIRKERREQNR